MPLSAGTRLGSYEILAPLGAGGMGEVSRAKDAKLGREVAIKALPAEIAADSGRFDRCRPNVDGDFVEMSSAAGSRLGP
jgi:serine/threonine protein kinase